MILNLNPTRELYCGGCGTPITDESQIMFGWDSPPGKEPHSHLGVGSACCRMVIVDSKPKAHDHVINE